MRAFPDTNVIVSAFISRGLCADVVLLILDEHDLISAEVVIEETRRVLSTRFKIPAEIVHRIELVLREGYVEPRPRDLPDLKLKGHADLLVVASALNAEADVLITGDKDILTAARTLKGLKVMTPREFWEMQWGPKRK